MIRILTTAALAAACATAASSTTTFAAPRGATWFECTGGWQPHPCIDGSSIGERGRRIAFRLPPPPPPPPEVPRYEIHPEGNGSVAGGGGAGGGGGGGGGGR